MKLLVTGGAGFIGSNFILYWLKKYPEDFIINLDKLTYAGNLENLKSIQSYPNYKFVQGDICDNSHVDQLMAGVDTVCHFAAESHVDRSIIEPSSFIQTNIVGTYILLQNALIHNIKRFHHISTDEVYGSLELSSDQKFSEESPYNPSSPYAATKASSDHLVRSYFHTYGLPITISNCSNNYGPFQHPEKLIPLTITNCIEGKKVPLYGDGKNVRDWLYVEDHCRALDIILHKGTIGETYCIAGSTKDISNRDVIGEILNIMDAGQDSIEYMKDRPGHDRKYAMDWSKIKRELGWQPFHTFTDWLQMTVAWYKNNISWWKRLKNDEFQTYYKKQYSRR